MALKTKTLEPEAYRALEDIVGPDYISQEPAILDGYCFVWGNELLFNGDKFSPRPLAVILPGSTQEVQAIVKVCNRYGIKFRPHASGFEIIALAAPEGFLPMDLRRMNRILEINEKSMYAVVEPAVTQLELTHEAIKKGLRPNVFGAGGSTSMVASACCHCGTGASNVSAGFGGSVALAVEWVLPDGELLKLGTLGSGCGWFSGDGPGPSLRGIMRGYMGPSGGLGVITKAAIKLSPWYGPPIVEAKGSNPNYEPEIPENLRSYTITFPDNEKMFEAFRLLCEEEGLAYAISRRGPFTAAAGVAGSAKEIEEIWKRGIYQEKFGHGAVLAIDASSPREMEYKETLVSKILAKTDGEILPEFNDPRQAGSRFGYVFIGLGCVKSTFRTGSFFIAPTGDESLDNIAAVKKEGCELKEEAAKQGAVLDDGDSTWVIPYNEYSVGSHCEVVYRYDPVDMESVKGAANLMRKANKLLLERKLGIAGLEGAFSYCNDIHDMFGPACMNYSDWMGRIKKAFDPRGAAEATFYITPEK
jgi:glycolate oxidase